MPRIEISLEINASRTLVFDLARSLDLHMISTSRTNEKAVAGRLSGLIELGETVTWRAKHLAFYQQLKVEITAFDRPFFFQDEMISGAFQSFVHEHHFMEIASDKTLMKDIFTYRSPLGWLGKAVDWLFLESYMRSFLLERNEIIKAYAESGKWKELPEMNNL